MFEPNTETAATRPFKMIRDSSKCCQQKGKSSV